MYHSIDEDAGGYFCRTCGSDLMPQSTLDAECLGPPPQIDWQALQIAKVTLEDSLNLPDDGTLTYTHRNREEALMLLKKYLEFKGCRWRAK